MKRIAVLVGALLLSATACGGGDDKATDDDSKLTGSQATAAASITQYWLDNDVDQTAASCLGDRMVREFGVAHLQDLGLIDEYEFLVQPVLAGHGPTLLAGLRERIQLELVDRYEFRSGAVALRYRPARATA